MRIRDGEHLRPDCLAINPHGRVPALREEDFILTESPAILSYLGQCHPEAGLLDLDDLRNFGRTHRLLSFFSSSVHIAFAQIWRAARFAEDEAAQAAVQASGRAAAERHFAKLEEIAGAGEWIVGNRFSIADPYLLVFYRWAGLIGADTGRYPRWTAHKERMLARPAVQRALATEGIEIV